VKLLDLEINRDEADWVTHLLIDFVCREKVHKNYWQRVDVLGRDGHFYFPKLIFWFN
jgi:hypothetical protein